MIEKFRKLLQISSICMVFYIVSAVCTSIMAIVGITDWIIPSVAVMITSWGGMIWSALAAVYVPWVILRNHQWWEAWVEMERCAEVQQDVSRSSARRALPPIDA